MGLQENLTAIIKTIPKHVKLIAVSKTQTSEDILITYKLGQRSFGENKAQELSDKFQVLPKDIDWHFIGHMQTNKVKYIAPFVNLIHSVDSIKIMETINKEAKKSNRIIDCLMEFHIAQEETKYGFDLTEAIGLLCSGIFSSLQNIRIVGVMGMATYTENQAQIRKEFQNLKSIFDHIKNGIFKNNPEFKEISMGMSDDYQIAIEEGSTMVRIGSSIFGSRNQD